MKAKRVFFFLAAFGLAQSAGAGQPFDGSELAMVRATMDFCAAVNPEVAATYREIAQFAAQGLPDDELTKVMASDDYKAAYDDVSAKLDEISDEEAAQACDSFVKVDTRS